jgi:hypothetical protein
VQWTEDAEAEEVKRLEIVSEFLEKKVVNFLLADPEDGPTDLTEGPQNEGDA